jgi:hypothetical protein
MRQTVKQWIIWLAIGLFLAAIGIIQFIPDPKPPTPAEDVKGPEVDRPPG